MRAKYSHPELAELEVVQLSPEEFLKLLEKEDRVTVIMMDSALDLLLAGLIGTAFRRRDKEVRSLFDHSNDGPLCSVTRKARLAYALGLIDKLTLDDLKNLHKIRNRFAHSIKADFNDREIGEAARKLSTAKGQKVNADNYLEFHGRAVRKCIQYVGTRYDERAGDGPLTRAARLVILPRS
jgi:DNA-binding MltR family transcriptional regulator